MLFVRPIRDGDIDLYTESIGKLLIIVHALGLTNYEKWLTIHAQDLASIDKRHPNMYLIFKRGNCIFKKTSRVFSVIALDQGHEQLNYQVKGDGGAVGVTENPTAMRRWSVSGPETARLIDEFDDGRHGPSVLHLGHHDQVPSVHKAFAAEVQALVSVIEEYGNPFLDDTKELTALVRQT